MSGSKCAYLEQAILDFLLGAQSFTPPGTLYVALSTANFSVASTGTSMSEVTGGAYDRVSVTNNLTSFPAAAGSGPASKSNGIDFDFGTATANWGTILSAYLCDASTDGNALYGADLAAPVIVNSGSGLVIAAGQWVVTDL